MSPEATPADSIWWAIFLASSPAIPKVWDTWDVSFLTWLTNPTKNLTDFTMAPIINKGSWSALPNPTANPFIPVQAVANLLPPSAVFLMSSSIPSKNLAFIPIFWNDFVKASTPNPVRPIVLRILSSCSTLLSAPSIISFWILNSDSRLANTASSAVDSFSFALSFALSSNSITFNLLVSILISSKLSETSFPFILLILLASSENFWASDWSWVKDFVAALVGSAKPVFHSLTIFLIDVSIPPNPSLRSEVRVLASERYSLINLMSSTPAVLKSISIFSSPSCL